LLETDFGFNLVGWRLLQEEGAFEPIQLRHVPAFAARLCKGRSISSSL
jgi:hypothetical protein